MKGSTSIYLLTILTCTLFSCQRNQGELREEIAVESKEYIEPKPDEYHDVTDDQLCWESLSNIEYSFGDASVPPPYHRSYRIEVSRDSFLRFTVESYGEVLKDTSAHIAWDAFFLACEEMDSYFLQSETSSFQDEDCTGGTHHRLTLTYGPFDGIFEEVELSHYRCGNETSGDLSPDIDRYVEFLFSIESKDFFAIPR